MALSGRILGSFNGANPSQVRPVIVWEATQKISGNYSTVTASLIFERYHSSWTSWNNFGHDVTFTIDGNRSTASRTFDIRNGHDTVWTRTVRVNHNADGTKEFALSASGNTGVSLGSYNFSGSETLDRIPRASSIDSFSLAGALQANSANVVRLAISRASTSFRHDIQLRMGNTTIASWNGQSIPTALDITAAQVNIILNRMRDSTSTTLTLRVQTKSGNTNIGNAVTATTRVNIHSSVAPSINNISITEHVADIRNNLGVFVQGKSRAAISFSTSAGYGARDGTISVSFDGRTYSSKNFTSNTISRSGTVTATITYTNTRGQRVSATETITVYGYSNPRPRFNRVYRSDSDGTANEDGDHATAEYTNTISSLNGTNQGEYTLRYKQSSEEYFSEVALPSQTGSYTFPADIDYVYDLQLVARDFFTEITAYGEVLSTFSLINYSADGKGIAFGGAYDESLGGRLQVWGDVYINGTKQ